jgi:hypothetical protein
MLSSSSCSCSACRRTHLGTAPRGGRARHGEQHALAMMASLSPFRCSSSTSSSRTQGCLCPQHHAVPGALRQPCHRTYPTPRRHAHTPAARAATAVAAAAMQPQRGQQQQQQQQQLVQPAQAQPAQPVVYGQMVVGLALAAVALVAGAATAFVLYIRPVMKVCVVCAVWLGLRCSVLPGVCCCSRPPPPPPPATHTHTCRRKRAKLTPPHTRARRPCL